MSNKFVDNVKQQIYSIADVKKVVIAYSGGVDSHVLLHVCSKINQERPQIDFIAVYIDHGLHADSAQWSAHCEGTCKRLDIEFTSRTVQGVDLLGEGPEQAARNARYKALESFIDEETVLLTAQHQDDQAETLLLQLLRGAGVNGLASMPAFCEFSRGFMARPLLGLKKQDILKYAQLQELSWIEDSSNSDTSLDRNFLRQEVIPIIKQRWPAFSKTSARTASHCAEASLILSNHANSFIPESQQTDRLDLASINTPDKALQRLIIRQWLAKNNARMPAEKVLSQLLQVVTVSPADSALIEWGQYQVRLFDSHFFFTQLSFSRINFPTTVWLEGNIELAKPIGRLSLNSITGVGIDKKKWGASIVSIKARQGGETIKLAGRMGRKKLKKLFHEHKILPWTRDIIPLIFIDEKLAAVADLWIAEEFLAPINQPGYEIKWDHPDFRIT